MQKITCLPSTLKLANAPQSSFFSTKTQIGWKKNEIKSYNNDKGIL